MTTTTTASEHTCTDCDQPIPAGAEIYLGHGRERRVFHQGCFERPSVPAQREPDAQAS